MFFWMRESTTFLSGLFADSALLAPCVFLERVAFAARQKDGTSNRCKDKWFIGGACHT